MARITFEEFQDSRVYCHDLGAALREARWEDDPVPPRGYLYMDCLYIQEVLPHWSEAARSRGGWYLLIERDEWISDQLADLERQLYDYAISAGVVE